MRPTSPTFRTLRKNLAALRRELLPRRFSPTGVYSERVLTRALAYRVLAHAEIEAFLETRVKDIVISAASAWKKHRRPTAALLALVAFAECPRENVPESVAPPQANQAAAWTERLLLDRRVQRCIKDLMTAINENHGVKERNLLRMLLPVGLPIAAFDPTWLAEMNSFGARRGHAAHQARVRQALDPAQELSTVNGLLLHLQAVDRSLSAIG